MSIRLLRRAAAVTLILPALVLAGCAGGGPPAAAGEAPDRVFPVPSGGLTVELFRTPVPVADLVFTDLDGRTLTTAGLRGKVTLINFWATWCGPCRLEIPDLVRLQERYPEHLQVIGVSIDEGPVDAVRRFAQEYRINYPIVMTTPEINRQFPGVHAIPTSFIVDTDARIVQSHIGLVSPAIVEQEMRHLASLSTNATVELVERTKQEQLLNAAHATEIPGVDLSELTPQQKAAALKQLNEDGCPCGCQLTLAQCRINDAACGLSLPIAEAIVAKIKANAL